MNYDIFTIPPFDKQLKRLSKKYPSIKKDFSIFLETIKSNPKQGKSLGKNCYKIRLAIKSKGKGKSAGARVILNIAISKKNVFLLSIYDKSKHINISNKEIQKLLEYLPDDMT